jgi:RNA polymerase sigma-70 factor (ECF subfamily)
VPGTIPVVTAGTVTPELRAARDTLRGGLSTLRQMLTVDLEPVRADATRTERRGRRPAGTTTSRRISGGAGTPGRRSSPTPHPKPEEAGTVEVRDFVAKAQAGDVEAFGRIYDRYNETVFRYIYFRVGNRQLAEDLSSETFLRALRRIGSFTWQGRDFGAWLVTIARNLVADHFKSGRYRLEMSTAEVLDIDREERSPEGNPEAMVCDMLTNATLFEAVKGLNKDQQECIVLRFLQGFSVAETARAMKKNEGAIKALQYRAVRTLARLLPEGFSR